MSNGNMHAKLPYIQVCALIDTLENDVKKAIDDSERLNRYQESLKMDVTPFENVENAKLAFQTKSKLWRSLNQWEKQSATWNSTQFASVDVESIQKEVQVFNKTCVQCEKAMPENLVVNRLKDSVVTFKNTLPVVVALRNKGKPVYKYTGPSMHT
jgi:dynein heavy chain, axonemal